jgi:hypothetical protein
MTNENAPNNSQNQQTWSQIVKRAQTDQQLHQQLLSDPLPALKAAGIEIPEGAQVRVEENSGHLNCIFELPRAAAAAAGAELSAEELSTVTGGDGKKTQTTSGQTYLVYTMKEVYVSSYQAS